MSTGEGTTFVTNVTYRQMKDAERYVQNYVIAWLNTATTDEDGIIGVCVGTLSTIQQIHKFTDGEKCLGYLRSVIDKPTFLILSCEIDDQLLNDFLELSQLEYIYHFGDETILRNEQSRLVNIESVEAFYDHLNQNLQITTEEDCTRNFAPLRSNTAVRSIQNLAEDARIFLFFQLLIEILLRLPRTPKIREQFYSFCMDKTNDNPVQQSLFQTRMESYTPEQAIPWYTGTWFLHKLLNRTCRSGNIKDMFKLAFFVIDLNAQLKILRDTYFDCYPENTHVYRGQKMSRMEYEEVKSSIGDLVVTKSFLSTTMDREAACFYAGVGTQSADKISVILHIIINKKRNETKPYAHLRYISQIPHDDEVLLSIGTVFRIVDEKHEDDLRIFTLIRDDDARNVEDEIQNNLRNQIRENNQFLDDHLLTDDIFGQMADIFTLYNDQTRETAEETTPLTIREENPAEADVTTQDRSELEILGTDYRCRRVHGEMAQLRNVRDIFICDLGPVYDTSLTLSGSEIASPSNIIIEGRILPRSQPYCERSFRVRFIIRDGYPFQPPELQFLDPMYHPNIAENGKICARPLSPSDSYAPTVTLAFIIKNVEELLSHVDEHHVVNHDVYTEYTNNRDEFNKKTLEFIVRSGQPRT